LCAFYFFRMDNPLYESLFQQLRFAKAEARTSGSGIYTGKYAGNMANWRVIKEIDVIEIIGDIVFCWFNSKAVRRRLVPQYIPAGAGPGAIGWDGQWPIRWGLDAALTPQYSLADLWEMAVQLFDPANIPDIRGGGSGTLPVDLPLDRWGCAGRAWSATKSLLLQHKNSPRRIYTGPFGDDKISHRMD